MTYKSTQKYGVFQMKSLRIIQNILLWNNFYPPPMSILFPLNFPSPSIWEICMLLCSLTPPMSILFPLNFPSPSIWEICMLLCSLKCALTQVPSTIYKVRFTVYEVRSGEGDGDGKRWWLHHIIYITTRERKNEKSNY